MAAFEVVTGSQDLVAAVQTERATCSLAADAAETACSRNPIPESSAGYDRDASPRAHLCEVGIVAHDQERSAVEGKLEDSVVLVVRAVSDAAFRFDHTAAGFDRDVDEHPDIGRDTGLMPPAVLQQHVRDASQDVSAEPQCELLAVVEDTDAIGRRVPAFRRRTGPARKAGWRARAHDGGDEDVDVGNGADAWLASQT